jgi:phage gpG-like protein
MSPAYAARKALAYPGQPIMRRTDRLYDSLTSETSDTIYDVAPQRLVMGTTVEYSEKHQEGGGRLPPRVHVQLLDDTFEELAVSMFVYVVDPLDRG